MAALVVGFAVTFVATDLAHILLGRLNVSRRFAIYVGLTSLVLTIATVALSLYILGIGAPVIGFAITVGLALGTFADTMGGLRIMTGESFTVGQNIEIRSEGIRGNVQELTLLRTVIVDQDRGEIAVPNRLFLDHPVTNRSQPGSQKTLRFELLLETPPGADLEALILETVPVSDDRNVRPDPRIFLRKIEAGTVTMHVLFRTAPYTYERVASDFLRALGLRLADAKVSVKSIALLKDQAE